MLSRIVLLSVLGSCVIGIVALSDSGAVVHEWGTFTSVAGEDGAAVSWRTLSGPSDLPCFVHRLDQRNWKLTAFGTVRMETPVMYFYPSKPTTVSVHVDFPEGLVTEWYPQTSSTQPSSGNRGWVEWKDIQLNKTAASLPRLGPASHYYAARETDSWPLKSEGENEKLLFYRGIGRFGVDLRAVVHANSVSIRNDGSDSIPEAMLFENREGHAGYRILRSLRDPVTVQFSDLGGTMDSLRGDFENELVEMGLYRKEAQAMLATWHDSWFEEGLRVFYIVPRAKVDSLLPASIHPAPAQFSRVFVGRVELLSPHMRQQIGNALQKGDVAVLQKYGRFLGAFLNEMSAGGSEPPMCERARQFLQKAEIQSQAESLRTSCAE